MAVAALESAVRACRPGRILVQSYRVSQSRSRRFFESLRHHGLIGSVNSPAAAEKCSGLSSGDSPGRNFASLTRPGSKGLANGGEGKGGWQNLRLSDTKQSTKPCSQRPKTPS